MLHTSKLFALILATTIATAYSNAGKSWDICKLTGLCEDYDNYPTELADRLIAKLGDGRKYLSMNEDMEQVARRLGDDPGKHIHVCPQHTETVHPTSGVGKDGHKKMILNSQDDPVQGYIVQVCDDGAQYNQELVRFVDPWVGGCAQSYITQSAMLIDEDKKATTVGDVQIPSTCDLVIEST